MAEPWVNNDSAREMTRKYNEGVKELNTLAKTLVGVNDAYVTLEPFEFSIGGNSEGDADDGT